MMEDCSGPKDNNLFRESIENGAETTPDAITYEGILNEYSYGIGIENEYLFNTTYTCGISKNPITSEYERYLCLEMKSKYDGEGLARNGGRPPMNFAFALDISGSMASSFSFGKNEKDKIEVAKECLINLLSKLQPKDKFGLILFNTTATTLVSMGEVQSLDLATVKSKIVSVQAGGGTTISVAMKAAEDMLKANRSLKEKDSRNSDRIFFLTDMNPADDCDILQIAHNLSEQDIYLSLIGLGVDFNHELAYKFASVKGCNSFSVSSQDEFRKQMNEDFDCSSMLICRDVSLKMQSSLFTVAEIYGSPLLPDYSIGEILKLNSICPSPICRDGGIKGGIVVLKLDNKQAGNGGDLILDLSYTDWDDRRHQQAATVSFPDDPKVGDYFQNNSVRKAISLIRYVQLMKEVLEKQKPENKQKLIDFKAYFVGEIAALNDSTMEKEVPLIDTLINK